MQHRFDVVTVTDCRLPGGTATSTAEEISAQARAGLRSGLVHVDTPLVGRTRPINPRLRRRIESGEASIALPTDHISSDLVVIRHPLVAASVSSTATPHITTDRCIVVINQAPTVDGSPVYDLGSARQSVEKWLGITPEFVPIGPLVRQSLIEMNVGVELLDLDWVNVIDVDEWRSERVRGVRRPVVVGRHSRDHYLKFPSSRTAVLAAYPNSPDLQIRILGGRRHLGRLVGAQLPRNWQVLDFDAMPPKRFLQELDVYAYFHHPDLVEAFGRNMLEALAVGLPVITHPHFTRLFGDAVVAAEPRDAARVLRELVDDRPRFTEQSARGIEIAVEKFGFRAHHERLEALTGRSIRARVAPITTPAPLSSTKSALYIGPNGAGLGHLTRLMAIARRSGTHWRTTVLTFSAAAKTVQEQGFDVRYFPSRSTTGSSSVSWHSALAERLEHLLKEIRPDVVVIDSTEPYRGLLVCLQNHPEVPVVWVRRGMWKPEVTNPVHEAGESFFDLIIEPGDLARADDAGETMKSDRSTLVGPITLLDPEEIATRAEARQFLGIADHEFAVLINLGAGNINDLSETLSGAIAGLSGLANTRVFAVAGPISERQVPSDSRVEVLRYFPLGRILRAFELVIGAAGYNTFHEVMVAGVPSVLVPNNATITDDQRRRAAWAVARGLCLIPDDDSFSAIEITVKNATEPESLRTMSQRLENVSFSNGAGESFELIESLLDGFDPHDTDRPIRRQRAFLAVEKSVERRAANKRRRTAERSARRQRNSMKGVLRSTSIRLMRRVKRRSLEVLGYQRTLAIYTLMPDRLQELFERVTNSTPGRTGADPTLLRIPPGRLLAASDEPRLTSIGFVLDPKVGNDVAAQATALLQTTMRNFKPLFVTTSLESTGFRKFGFAWEHFPASSATETFSANEPNVRLDEVLRWYRPDLVVEVDDIAMLEDPTSALRTWLRTRPHA